MNIYIYMMLHSIRNNLLARSIIYGRYACTNHLVTCTRHTHLQYRSNHSHCLVIKTYYGMSYSFSVTSSINRCMQYHLVTSRFQHMSTIGKEVNVADKVIVPEKLTEEELPSKWQRFFLGRFAIYLKRSQKMLEDEMPDTFKMLKTFTYGLKDFVVDFGDYVKILMQLSLPFYNLEDLEFRELNLYYNMPSQMIRVFPVLALSSLPFGQNVIFPIAYWMPRHLLCYHFWTDDQRLEFGLIYLRRKLFNSRPVFRCLQGRVDDIEDEELSNKCKEVFFALGSGVHPSLDDVIAIKNAFNNGNPYHYSLLAAAHVNALLRQHSAPVLPFRRKRLKEHARFMLCLDSAMNNKGVDNLSHKELIQALLFRCINPSGLSDSQMRGLLLHWLTVSSNLDQRSASMLLHLPVLLAYNHPTNLSLIAS